MDAKTNNLAGLLRTPGPASAGAGTNRPPTEVTTPDQFTLGGKVGSPDAVKAPIKLALESGTDSASRLPSRRPSLFPTEMMRGWRRPHGEAMPKAFSCALVRTNAGLFARSAEECEP
jgi:hypothetical protein